VGRHHPGQSADGYVLCGHIHPVFSMRSRRERMRLPVFWLTPRYAVLPSFGSFTGGAEIEPGPEDRVYAAAADRTWWVPIR
jgi:metallophosphoesterase superfamily enzyme